MKRTKFAVAGFSVLLVSVVIAKTYYNQEEVIRTPAERTYDAITAYADSFQVPLYVAYNIATLETGFRGPADSTYNPSQVSHKGAMGPMQIMYKYANYFAGHPVTKPMLRDSIEFNVRLSMKILNKHYQKYQDWKVVAGVYNTGRPIINTYARKAADSTYYVKRWMPS